jgi:hypothetical protein
MSWEPKFKTGQCIKWAGHDALYIKYIDDGEYGFLYYDEDAKKIDEFSATGTAIDKGITDRRLGEINDTPGAIEIDQKYCDVVSEYLVSQKNGGKITHRKSKRQKSNRRKPRRKSIKSRKNRRK